MVDATPPTPPEPSPPSVTDPLLTAVQQLTERRWSAQSAGGEVRVEVSGGQRVTSVELVRDDLPAPLLGARLTEAVNAALTQARAETVEAMQQLPELGPQLRTILGEHRG